MNYRANIDRHVARRLLAMCRCSLSTRIKSTGPFRQISLAMRKLFAYLTEEALLMDLQPTGTEQPWHLDRPTCGLPCGKEIWSSKYR